MIDTAHLPKPDRPSKQHSRHESISPGVIYELLVEHFGGQRKMALDFMTAFQGLKLWMPKNAEVQAIARRARIVEVLDRDPSPDSVARLGRFLSMTPRQVAKAYQAATGRG